MKSELETPTSHYELLDEKINNIRISNLDSKVTEQVKSLDTKVDNLDKRLTTQVGALDIKVEALNEKIDTKVGALDIKIDTKIDALGTILIEKINSSDKRTTVLMWFVGIGTAFIVGLLTVVLTK